MLFCNGLGFSTELSPRDAVKLLLSSHSLITRVSACISLLAYLRFQLVGKKGGIAHAEVINDLRFFFQRIH